VISPDSGCCSKPGTPPPSVVYGVRDYRCVSAGPAHRNPSAANPALFLLFNPGSSIKSLLIFGNVLDLSNKGPSFRTTTIHNHHPQSACASEARSSFYFSTPALFSTFQPRRNSPGAKIRHNSVSPFQPRLSLFIWPKEASMRFFFIQCERPTGHGGATSVTGCR